MGKAWLAAMALCMSAAPAWAAREFTPQAGLWMIPSENNGQPGRGFSLDVQGNTAFLQVFNYEKNGAATFHTAVGQLDDSAAMTVPLLRFKGGRSFGGPVQDAVSDGTAGDVTVKFADGLNGTVQFPGESEQPISRFLIDQKLPFWWTQASEDPPVGNRGGMSFRWYANGADGTRKTWSVVLQGDASGALTLAAYPRLPDIDFYYGDYYQDLTCKLEASTQIIDCSAKKISDIELPEADLHGIARVRFRILGRDIVGVIQPKADPDQRITLNGWTRGSFGCKEPCSGELFRTTRSYTLSDYVNRDNCITGFCTGYGHVMLQPTSGAWVIEEENTGKPGRGVFLDVQDGAIVMQTSDYLANGEPTFHMGSGGLKSKSSPEVYSDTTTAMQLVRYAGGRYFGGPAQTGHDAATAGMVGLSFSLLNGGTMTDFATGSITLPGETTKTIRRLDFNPPGAGIDHLLGEYFIHWRYGEPNANSWVQLSRIEGRYAMNADGTVKCSQSIPRLDPYAMHCELRGKTELGQVENRSADISVNPFHRDLTPSAGPYFLRTRDQYGHWLGLGAVNLPGLAIARDQ